MDRFTRDLIFALKDSIDPIIENAAIDFLSSYTITPKSVYTPEILRGVVKNHFLDYVSTADHPESVVRTYLEKKDYPWNYGDAKAMLTAMMLEPVRKDGKYINGFWGGD